jgi:DNA (cytosine-5)-methyltransferase 1
MNTAHQNNHKTKSINETWKLVHGLGGFDLAAEEIGWENVFQVEIDNYCTKVLEKNFPNAKRYRDIREFDGTQYRGTIDVLTGGFPCQSFSQAGKRKGKEDERYLWPEMLRAIREIQPTWIIAENVSGLLTLQNGVVFEQVCTDLEKEDYEVQPFIIPACAKNAPHRRDRIWIIANARHRDAQRTANQEKYAEQGRSRNAIESERPIESDGIRITSNAKSGKPRKQTEQKRRKDIGRSNKIIAYTPSERCQDSGGLLPGVHKSTKGKWKNKDIGDSSGQTWSRNWVEVATELCRVDARVSDRIHRLKALGNSIVPQIAFEIFQAIEATENMQ